MSRVQKVPAARIGGGGGGGNLASFWSLVSYSSLLPVIIPSLYFIWPLVCCRNTLFIYFFSLLKRASVNSTVTCFGDVVARHRPLSHFGELCRSKEPRSSACWDDNCAPPRSLEWIWKLLVNPFASSSLIPPPPLLPRSCGSANNARRDVEVPVHSDPRPGVIYLSLVFFRESSLSEGRKEEIFSRYECHQNVKEQMFVSFKPRTPDTFERQMFFCRRACFSSETSRALPRGVTGL